MSKPIIFRNIASDGARDLPLLGRVIDSGEEFEVTPAQAAELYPQADVWELVSGIAPGGIVPSEVITGQAEAPASEAVIPLTDTTEGK